ncbi:unnamed protein product [Orchesella dallaii]|uniref:ABC transmembrane type-1 domain-containing protein n=1 Tax=Orchesella dallaii TaxID=48710 RepID=A0ABP1RF78_9HEXA
MALNLHFRIVQPVFLGRLLEYFNDPSEFRPYEGYLVAPIQLALVIGMLYWYVDLGYPAFCGLILVAVFVPLQSFMGHTFGKLRAQTASKTDDRLVWLEEILAAIRMIKLYTWELYFSDHVTETRRAEIKVLQKTAIRKAINQSIFSVTSRTTLFVTLLTYSLTGGLHDFCSLPVRSGWSKNYTDKCLHNLVRIHNKLDIHLQYITGLFLPCAILSLAETLVALRRIKSFLLLEERIPPNSSALTQSDRLRKYELGYSSDGDSLDSSAYTLTSSYDSSTLYDGIGVKANNITAQWNSAQKENAFSNVSFEVRAGEILACK